MTPAATEQEKQALTVVKNNLDTPATTTGMTPESIDAYNKAKDAAQAQVDEAKAEAQAALDKGANATQAEVAAAKAKVDAAQQALDAAKANLVPQADKKALEAAKAELDQGIQAAPDTSGKTPDSVTAYNKAKTEAETAAQEAQVVINDQNASEQAVQDAIAKVTKAKEALDQAKTNLTPAATEQEKQALTVAKNNLDTPATTTGMTPESIDAYNKAKDAAQAQVDEAKAEAQAALDKGANATQAEVAAAKAKVDAAQQALDAAKANLVPQADKKALEAAKAELDQGIQAAPDTSGKTPDSVTAYNKAKTEAETAAQEAQVVINDQNASEQAVQDAIAKVTKAKEALDQAKTNLTPAATEQEKQALTVAKNNLDTPATTTGMTPESIDAYNKAKDAAQAQVDEAKAEAQAALDKGANATQAEVAAAKAKVDAAQQALDAAKANLVPQADKKALEAAKAELDQGIQAAPDTSGKTPDSVTAYNKAKTEAETAAQEAQVVINDQNASEQAVQDAIAKVTKAKEALDQAKTNLTPAATEQEKQALTVAKNNLDTPATTTGMTPESIDAYNKAKDAAQAQVDEAKAEAQAALDKGANATQAEVAAAKAKVDAAQQALDAAKANLVPQADKKALEAAKAELDQGIQAAPDTSGKTPDSVTAYNKAKTTKPRQKLKLQLRKHKSLSTTKTPANKLFKMLLLR
ncbi:hypothetical protein [Streptococcus bouchesdurhonensis]|uniref:hypothetical protein n=1 Tax=Streptococcus bouchesdurhonensis TaxID=2954240 RepID=UPI0021C3DE1A|nr:hypothetical protein [Streptococcus bouchesdurhonensis]